MKLGSENKSHGDHKKREVPPAGMHVGILFRIVDAGWCVSEFKGEKKMRTEGRLDFELWPLDSKTNEFVVMEDGRPFCVAPGFQGWLTFTKMGEVLTSWVGSPTADSELILGQAAMLNIIHKPYKNRDGVDCIAANVASVLPVPDMIKKAMAIPEMANPPMVYSVKEHDPELFAKLPKWIQQHIIDKSADYHKLPENIKLHRGDTQDPGPTEPMGDTMDPRMSDPDLPF